MWICKMCETSNEDHLNYCEACGAIRPQPEPPPAPPKNSSGIFGKLMSILLLIGIVAYGISTMQNNPGDHRAIYGSKTSVRKNATGYIPKENAIPYDIILEGKRYTLPCLASELIADGWNFYGTDYSTIEYYSGYGTTVQPGEYGLVMYRGQNDYDVKEPPTDCVNADINLYNPLDSSCMLAECWITEISMDSFDNWGGSLPNFSYQGIRIWDSMSKAKSVLMNLPQTLSNEASEYELRLEAEYPYESYCVSIFPDDTLETVGSIRIRHILRQ